MRKIGAALLLVWLFLVTIQEPADAYICPRVLNPYQHVRGAEVILLARVTQVGELDRAVEPMPAYPLTLAAEQVYKGDPADRRIYAFPVYGPAPQKAGERWLLFLARTPQGDLRAGPCTPMFRIRDGEAVPLPVLWVVAGPWAALTGTAAGRLLLLGAAIALVLLVLKIQRR